MDFVFFDKDVLNAMHRPTPEVIIIIIMTKHGNCIYNKYNNMNNCIYIIFDNKNTLKEHFKIKPSCYKKKNSDNNETSTKINDVDTISINNPEINFLFIELVVNFFNSCLPHSFFIILSN